MPKANRFGPIPWFCVQSSFRMLLLLGWFLVFGSQHALSQEKSTTGAVTIPNIGLEPVGRVEHRDGKIFVDVESAYTEALEGIEGFSQIWVIYWFHGNDTSEKRRTLKVHPRGNPANPLTGVFATRSPDRPNLLGLSACLMVRRDGNRLEVEGLDAWDGSPLLDIKPYLPQFDAFPQTTIPTWAAGKPPE
jgi:tRNA-Thr(GGU) m(6)t(6)A37 methyltransferase TsaA